jgi:hypothetical protein
MSPEEAVRACEFWTTSVAGNIAIGSTRNPRVGIALHGKEFQPEAWSAPEKRGWTIQISRSEETLFRLIEEELERRGQGQ